MSEGELFKPGRITFVHSIRDLLREIHERPALWLGSKTLTGLKCLLFGYEIACALHDIAEASQVPDDIPWQGFSEWLSKRYDKVDWSVDWHWLGTDLGFGSAFNRRNGSAPDPCSQRGDQIVCLFVLFSRRRSQERQRARSLFATR